MALIDWITFNTSSKHAYAHELRSRLKNRISSRFFPFYASGGRFVSTFRNTSVMSASVTVRHS